MKFRSLLLLLVTIILVSCNSNQNSDGYSLRLNLKKGETYKINHVTKSIMTQTNPQTSMTQEVENIMTLIISLKVTDIEDENYIGEVSIERMKLEMSTEGQNMMIDTDNLNDSSDISGLIFKGIMNFPFNYVMSKNGKVIEVTGYDELLQSLEKFQAPGMDLNTWLSGLISEEAFSGHLELFTNVFPENEVSNIGDTWEKNTDDKSGIPVILHDVWTFDSVLNDVYVLSSVSTYTPDSVALSQIQADVKYNVNGTQKSKIKINKETGWMQSGLIEGEIDSETIYKVGDQEMKMPVKLVLTSEFSVLN